MKAFAELYRSLDETSRTSAKAGALVHDLHDASLKYTFWVMHGQPAPLVRWLSEHGRQAVAIEAHFAEDET
jgi:hypothetical protein